MKQKIYVITLSKVFPKIHKRKGEPTFFEEKFLRKQKLHTIRANYDLWKERIEEIQKGNAVLSVRQWTGMPYRSKQREIACLTDLDGIGLQELKMIDLFSPCKIGENMVELHVLSENDGLNFSDWYEWFKGYSLSSSLAIIHFTKFRY